MPSKLARKKELEDKMGQADFWNNQEAAKGVEFVSEPKKEPWGEYAVFKDPDGNQFVVGSR